MPLSEVQRTSLKEDYSASGILSKGVLLEVENFESNELESMDDLVSMLVPDNCLRRPTQAFVEVEDIRLIKTA